MPLRIACPEGHTLIVSHARGGSTLRCPKCGSAVAVPGAPPQPAAAEMNLPAVALRQEMPIAPAAVLEEPVPPPVVALPKEVVPPPVWSPPPKSRAIVEPAPQPMPQPMLSSEPPRVEPPEGEPEPVPPEPAAMESDRLDAPATPIPFPEPEPDLGPETEVPTGLHQPAAEPPRDEPPLDEPLDEPPVVHSPRVGAASADAQVGAQTPCVLIPNRSQQLTAYLLALSLAAAALFGSGPAVWDVMQYSQAAPGGFVARWALILFALGGVQIAYAIYFAQLPDWLSGWVVTLVSLAMAALYAGMLGVTLIAGPESFLIRTFELADALANGRAAMWCLCMTTIMASLAFFAGRASLRWRQSAGAW